MNERETVVHDFDPKDIPPDILTTIRAVVKDIIPLTRTLETATPIISIGKPTGEFADKATWSHMITYDTRDESTSYQIFMFDGETPKAEILFFDDRPSVLLTTPEVQTLARDLRLLPNQS